MRGTIFKLLIGCVVLGSALPAVAQDQSILEIVQADPGNFSTLEAALNQTGVNDTLAGGGTYTVFAPTNAAFETFLEEESMTAEQLLGSGDMLRTYLEYHVLNSKVMSGDVPNGDVVATLAQLNIGFDTTDGGVMIAHSRSDKANVTLPDVEATNGVVHVIDRVLVPPTMTITETVASNSSLSALLLAVTAASFGDELAGEDQLTVFAPTNDGVANTLGSQNMTEDQLLAGDDLIKYLQYHVVNGTVLRSSLTENTTIPTLGGMSLPFVTDGDASDVNDIGILTPSNLVTTDLIATNGVVHIVSKMMIPSDEPAQQQTTPGPSETTSPQETQEPPPPPPTPAPTTSVPTPGSPAPSETTAPPPPPPPAPTTPSPTPESPAPTQTSEPSDDSSADSAGILSGAMCAALLVTLGFAVVA